MGAATALALAGTRPDVPGAILLEDPPQRWLGAPGVAADPEWRERQRARLTGYQRKTREELIAEQRTAAPSWSEAELGPWANAKLRFNLNALNRGDAADIDWPATLRRISCPALLITADPERGGLVTEEGAAALRELVPQLRVAHIPEAGHNIRRDQFDRYLAIVRDFLAETTAGR
jgi:pimeloyl-ACP methyl ester carboxylesterase